MENRSLVKKIFDLVSVVGLLASFSAIFLLRGRGFDIFLYSIAAIFFVLFVINIVINKKIYDSDAMVIFHGKIKETDDIDDVF